jgi:hypothetical protein
MSWCDPLEDCSLASLNQVAIQGDTLEACRLASFNQVPIQGDTLEACRLASLNQVPIQGVTLEACRLASVNQVPIQGALERPVFSDGSNFNKLKNLELSKMCGRVDIWSARRHCWKGVYGKSNLGKKQQMLSLLHNVLSSIKDVDTDEGVVLTVEEVAAYMGVEMPQ